MTTTFNQNLYLREIYDLCLCVCNGLLVIFLFLIQWINDNVCSMTSKLSENVCYEIAMHWNINKHIAIISKWYKETSTTHFVYYYLMLLAACITIITSSDKWYHHRHIFNKHYAQTPVVAGRKILNRLSLQIRDSDGNKATIKQNKKKKLRVTYCVRPYNFFLRLIISIL